MRVVGPVRIVFPGDEARDCRAVGKLRPVVSGRAGQKPLDDVLVPELEMRGIDAGIQHSDQHALAGRNVRTVLQFKIGIGLVGPDRAQAPLVFETRGFRQRAGDRIGHRHELGFGDTALIVGLDAGILDFTDLIAAQAGDVGNAAGQEHGCPQDRDEDPASNGLRLAELRPSGIPRSEATKDAFPLPGNDREQLHFGFPRG